MKINYPRTFLNNFELFVSKGIKGENTDRQTGIKLNSLLRYDCPKLQNSEQTCSAFVLT
jgi:hypothetical protein